MGEKREITKDDLGKVLAKRKKGGVLVPKPVERTNAI